MEVDNDSFIALLQAKLTEALPGKEVQERMSPKLRNYRNIIHDKPVRQCAVMLLLYPKKGELFIAYFKRPEYEGPHSGQIAFPGGKAEIVDGSLKETALRETNEEFGIVSDLIRVLGSLTKLYIPISNMEVTPYVGYLSTEPLFKPNNYEVSYIIEIPVLKLLDDTFKRMETKIRHGIAIDTPMYLFDKEEIWGATAMITSEFEEIVRTIHS